MSDSVWKKIWKLQHLSHRSSDENINKLIFILKDYDEGIITGDLYMLFCKNVKQIGMRGFRYIIKKCLEKNIIVVSFRKKTRGRTRVIKLNEVMVGV